MARSVRCLLALMAALFLAGTGAAAEGKIVFNLTIEPQTIDSEPTDPPRTRPVNAGGPGPRRNQ